MDDAKARYYHAQAARLDLRRKWQSMAIWPIVHRFGDQLRMEFECQHGPYRMDLYIPDLKLAIEIDEPHHERQRELDSQREEVIRCGLGCEFLRLKVIAQDGRSLFGQLEDAMALIERRLQTMQPPPWTIAPKRFRPVRPTREGGYSEENLRRLAEAEIPELVDDFMKDLAAVGFELFDDVRPVQPSNGELGFTAGIAGMTFCVSVRSNKLAKLLVVEFQDAGLKAIGISLDGPKHGSRDYWNINELVGRFPVEIIRERLLGYRQALLFPELLRS